MSTAQAQSDNQQWKNYDLEYRKVQVSIIPGIGTNGFKTTDYASKYSFNLLGGYNGALQNGFELGSLVNAHKYYASGVQLAGLANFSGESTAGVQIAGLGNFSGKHLQGIQIAGISNWANSNIQGLQFSGVFNASGGDMQGLLLSGGGNISTGFMQGLLFGGLFNIARGNMQGIISSGGLNYSKDFQGISLGSVNASNHFQGIQFGLANITGDGQGIQAGLINYGNTFEGLPIGLFSYYGDGRKNIDLWTTETGFTNLGIKLGTNDVYNMPSIGFNPFLGRDVWQLGWSIGSLREYSTHFLYRDFSYHKVNESGWTNDLNSIFKYRLLFGKKLTNQVKIHGGPSFNMLVSRLDESSDYLPYRLFDFEAKGRDYVFWIGGSIGFELF
ncbi:MAG: hypothetical protein ACQEST_00350 [Bacteroidota bacterium]